MEEVYKEPETDLFRSFLGGSFYSNRDKRRYYDTEGTLRLIWGIYFSFNGYSVISSSEISSS